MKRALVFLVLLLAATHWAAAAPPQPASPTYGSVVAGTPTGGHKGNGSINAQSYYLNGTAVPAALPLAGGTLTGKLITTPSTTGSAGFNIPPGVVPASPVDGDMWSTPAGYFVQVNGSTVGPLGIGGGGGGGNVTSSGTPAVNQLAQWVSTTAIRGLALDSSIAIALGNPPNASGGLLEFSKIGTSGAAIPLLNAANTWSAKQSYGDGFLALNGSSSGAAVLHGPASGGGNLQLPAGNVNMAYQSGAWVDQHCLKAVGTAGGIGDAGALCGSGSGGINQLTGDVTAGPGTGSVAATVVAAPLGGITGMGTNVRPALAIAIGTAGSPVLNGGVLGTPSSGNGGNLTNLQVASLTGIVPVAKGGTGTATPSLVPGTNISITGSWPNQTINSPSGAGTLTSLAAGTPDLLVNSGTCTSGACTVSTQTLLNTQSGSSYAIISADNTKVVEMTNAAATATTIAGAGSSGFGVDWGITLLATLAKTTLTPSAGTLCGQPDMTIGAQTPLSIASDNVSNYVCALGAPPDGVWVSSQRFAYQAPAIATATFTPTSRGGNNIRINLTSACPCTLATFSGTLVAGQQGTIEIAQDSGGSRTIGTWGSAYVTAGGTASITLSTGSSAVDYLPYRVDSTATKIVLSAIILAPTH